MTQLYCGDCQNYLMGSDGQCHDCSCGWNQPVETYEKENAELKEIIESLHSSRKFTYENQKSEIESLRKQVEELRSHLTAVVEEMNHLMNDSKGVAGLHLNGDIAPWASLLRGGEFDTWLSYLSDAAEYIQSKNGE